MSFHYRLPSQADCELIGQWIESDPDHRGRCKPEFWIPGEEKGVQAVVSMDAAGPAMFTRIENCARLHIQFAPDQKIRTGKALIEGLKWLIPSLKERGYKQIIFDSVSEPLIEFLERLGFKNVKNEYLLDI